MKQFLLRSAICAASAFAFVSSARAQMLQQLIGSSNNRNELITSVKALPDGSAVMGGYIYDIVSNTPVNIDMLLLRVRPDGSIVWQKQIGSSSASAEDLVNSVIVTQNSDIVMVGTVGRHGAYQDNTAAIFRFDSSGTLLWQRYVRCNPAAGQPGEVLRSVTELTNGTLIAVGVYNYAPSVCHSMICSFTAGGVLNYIEERNRPSSDEFLGVCAVGNDVIITGWYDGVTYKDTRIMRYRPGTTSGTVIWDKSYDVLGSVNGFGTPMPNDGLDNVFVRGNKVVASAHFQQSFGKVPSLHGAFRCDLATGNNPVVRDFISGGYAYANNAGFYPVDSETYYVSQNPAPTFQDAVLWTAPSFTNAIISKVRPFNTTGQVQASREYNLPGSQSIFSMDIFANALFMAGCSNSGTTVINNDIYFVLSMSSLTNPNATCDLIDDSLNVTAPTLSPQTPTETMSYPTSTASYTVTFSNPGLVSTKACGEIVELKIAHTTSVPGLQSPEVALSLYPLPASDKLILKAEGTDGPVDVRIMNATGQLLQSLSLRLDASGKADINTEELVPGNYFLQVISGNRLLGVRPFVIAR